MSKGKSYSELRSGFYAPSETSVTRSEEDVDLAHAGEEILGDEIKFIFFMSGNVGVRTEEIITKRKGLEFTYNTRYPVEAILKIHSKNLKDKVVKIKMQEAIKSINKFCGTNDKSDVVKDEYVVQTMRYLELLKELKKSGNKKQRVI